MYQIKKYSRVSFYSCNSNWVRHTVCQASWLSGDLNPHLPSPSSPATPFRSEIGLTALKVFPNT